MISSGTEIDKGWTVASRWQGSLFQGLLVAVGPVVGLNSNSRRRQGSLFQGLLAAAAGDVPALAGGGW